MGSVVFLTSNLEARGAIGQLQKAPLLPTGVVGIRGTGSVSLALAPSGPLLPSTPTLPVSRSILSPKLLEPRSNEGQLMLALQAHHTNPGLSIRAAAKIYGVSRKTLKRRHDHVVSRQDIMPNCRKLTDLEESTIIQYVLDLDARSFPPRLRGVEDMANRLLADRDAPPVGINWASKFVKRHQELSTRKTRSYDYQRALCEDQAVIRGWFQLVRDTVAKYGLQDEDMYNFDETGFAMGIISTTMVVTSSERRGKPRLAQPGNREWVSVIQGINSQGWAIPPFIIVAGKHHLSNWYEDSTLPSDWVIATTHNGWTTNEKGVEWIQHFEKHTKPRTCGAYRLLIMDGHESHHSTGFELFSKEHRIITLCMPAHSLHILQLLDVGCFGPLKKAYGREIEGLMKARITHITKTDFLPAFFAAHQAAMTEKNIKGAFRGAGIVPFNAESVLARLDVKVRTPSPVEGTIELPAVWVPKTPNNPTEATCQTDYIKRRISRHQGSSPTSILTAMDQFAKGARGIMHRMALLRAEVETLRVANATLSKRRRARKTRLREGGSMIIAERQALQDERDVEQQLQQDIHESRGRKPRNKTKGRRCGACGKPGHNLRTCQMAVEMLNEGNSEED
ncbi:transposase [Metarhizium guizhouense ARSEF 977]|uniref:Transposase n=1 Tax=Metarhizium guizhouense (strain ARSEF 977) TaxID=1276136 RepID=A0A0B4G317_METGA|nr:transposase [Metarhizium guizhouense ARSEF 977]